MEMAEEPQDDSWVMQKKITSITLSAVNQNETW